MARATAGKSGRRAAEVCRMAGVEPYVLRYWEREFPSLAAAGSAGPRTYSDDEVALIQRIKTLLYDEGYTIAGARRKLEAEAEPDAPPVATGVPATASIDTPAASLQNDRREQIEAAVADLDAALAILGEAGNDGT